MPVGAGAFYSDWDLGLLLAGAGLLGLVLGSAIGLFMACLCRTAASSGDPLPLSPTDRDEG